MQKNSKETKREKSNKIERMKIFIENWKNFQKNRKKIETIPIRIDNFVKLQEIWKIVVEK